MKRIFLILTAALVFNCSTPPEEDLPRLEILGEKSLTLAVGDTSVQFKVERTFVDLNGRQKTEDYTRFFLVSSDSAIATIVQGQKVLAVSPGDVIIHAKAESGNLVSKNSVSVTVAGEQ